ncbi:MAG TPA: sensor histidine kinase [Candidatus Acidoferrales bacterium]|nr:sensor histidine kinase [Candidatus Acidoferrales bacterium]
MNYGSLVTAPARRHLRLLARALVPISNRLEERFRAQLMEHAFDGVQSRALLAITPVAAARLRTLDDFFEQVQYNGRRLAKLNLPPSEVIQTLAEFATEVESALDGSHAPAREQLHLLTTLVLNQAYFEVRESEAQAFFGLYHAEAEAADLDDLLLRLVRILSWTFHARGGRIFLVDRPPTGKLAGPLYARPGRRAEALIACPELRGSCQSFWSFPVRDVALIQLGFATEYPWLPRELALLQAVAERCYEAIHRSRVDREFRRLEAAARHAEEEERRRIGRELHDEAAQSLLLLRLQLEMMQRDAPPELHPRLAQTRTIAERTIEELRRTISALSPAQLERLGLERALRQLASRLRKVHPADVRIRIPERCGELARPAQEVIYRVAQESLNNILKHSQATRVNLLLDSTDKSIRLSVRDNGMGFRPESALAKPMSFGLAGMRERAVLLGGKLDVRSAPGRGATVTLELPRAS